MIWTGLALFLLLLCFGVPMLLWGRIRKKGRVLEAEMRRELGGALVLISGCGIISGYSRVPGVLALSRTHLVHRSLVMDCRGKTPLSGIRGFTLESSRSTGHARARKYRRAVVLEVEAPGSALPLFVLPEARAEAWNEALNRLMGLPQP
ncbi:MAG: hypothetical protein AB1921_06330 [Thermodesulfobacteriota bacterium]